MQAYPDIKMITNCDGSSQQLDHPADFYDFHVNSCHYLYSFQMNGTSSIDYICDNMNVLDC